jgi:hypothetical protein
MLAAFGDQSLLMEYKSPSLGLQLTEALSDDNLADVTVINKTSCSNYIKITLSR